MKQLLLSLAFILIGATAMAQQQGTADEYFNNNRFEFDFDYHYTIGMSESHTPAGDFGDKLYGHSWRGSLLYQFQPRLKAGLGFGLENYYEAEHRTFPIFLAAQYSPLKNNLKLFLFSNLGYSLSDKEDDFTVGGLLFETGVGYKYMYSKHFGVKLELGYNFKSFAKNEEYDRYRTSYRNSLTMGIGLVF